jgi:hypothetical protein
MSTATVGQLIEKVDNIKFQEILVCGIGSCSEIFYEHGNKNFLSINGRKFLTEPLLAS